MLVVFFLIEAGQLRTVNSAVLDFETHANPNNLPRLFIRALLDGAQAYQAQDDLIEKQADALRQTDNLGHLDALHLAVAERLGVDFFITCDDRIIKRYSGPLAVRNPIDFIRESLP